MTTRKKLLMVAYACCPDGGGEHWLGWGWALTAQANHDVWLLTPPNHVEAIQDAADKAGIRVRFVPLPFWKKWFCEFFGVFGVWLRKLLWQRSAYKVARKLHNEIGFDLVHQTTFHTFRIPFNCSSLPIPSVWGPIAGGESVPKGFEKYLGPDAKSEMWRYRLNRVCLWLPGVQASLTRACAILVSNRTTLEFLPRSVRERCIVLPANAVNRADLHTFPDFSVKGLGTLELLYVGNCVARRGIPLVLEALKSFTSSEIRLRVVGDGPALSYWKQEAYQSGVQDRVVFSGSVPSELVREYYRTSSALVFPSLRDSGGSALLEAMTWGLPVLCLDWGGPAEMLDADSGIKLPVRCPVETVSKMVEALRRLRDEPEWAVAMGAKGRERALTVYSWDGKQAAIESVYNRLMQH